MTGNLEIFLKLNEALFAAHSPAIIVSLHLQLSIHLDLIPVLSVIHSSALLRAIHSFVTLSALIYPYTVSIHQFHHYCLQRILQLYHCQHSSVHDLNLFAAFFSYHRRIHQFVLKFVCSAFFSYHRLQTSVVMCHILLYSCMFGSFVSVA